MDTVRKLHPSSDDTPYRLAPHNIEAEQALLGAILVNNEAYYRVSDFLEPIHFYEAIHSRIYDVLGQIVKAGRTATPVTAKTHLPDDPVGDISMQQYLARLAAEATTVLNAHDFGREIYDAAIKRDLIQIGEEMVEAAYSPEFENPPNVQIEAAEKHLFELAEQGHYNNGFQGFSNAMKMAIELAAEAHRRDGKLSGTATGLVDLDRQMGGLQRSDLVILAGRPGMAKTSLATNIAVHVAKTYKSAPEADGRIKTLDGGVVGFFSLEMSSEQLATRILSAETDISSSDIRRGDIHESQFNKLIDASRMLNELQLFIDDTGGLNIAQLMARARRLKRQKGLDVLIIDYIQLLSGSGKRGNENRVQELTEITTSLKALAKELEVPIVALSQLSRQVESRDDKRPQLSDLRESGSIEQDAEVVLFIYRDEYYLKNKEPEAGTPKHLEWQADMERVHGKAEVIIGKQRHGPTGTVNLAFEGQYTRFSNLARDQYAPERIDR